MARAEGLWRVASLALFVCALAMGAEDSWFETPQRQKCAKLGWGETDVQELISEDMVKENPWWQAVRHWKANGARGHLVRQKMLLIGGLPRSGTTLLEMFLRGLPEEVSGLQFSKDDNIHEGLKLLGSRFSVYGGGSKNTYAGMCSVSALETHRHLDFTIDEFRREAWRGWQSWNFSKPVLAVKDPPNLLRIGFLQEAFQDTHDVFAIFTLMHPLEIASRYDCDPSSSSRRDIGRRWLNCHDRWLENLKQIRNYLVIPYEAWFLHPHSTGLAIESFLHLKEHVPVRMPDAKGSKPRRLVFHGKDFLLSRKFFARCMQTWGKTWTLAPELQKAAGQFEQFGYNISNSMQLFKPRAFELCVLDGIPCRLL